MRTGLLTLAPLQVAQALVGLGAIAAFTRLMSAEEFGQYAIALSLSMLAHTLMFTAIEAAAFRFVLPARAQGRAADHFATLLALALSAGAAGAIVTGAALALSGVSADVSALALFAAGAAILRFLVRIARESDRADLALGRYAALETIYLLTGFTLGVLLLMRFDLGAAAPFAGLMAAGALVLVIDAPRLFKLARGGAPSLPRAMSYAGYGAPLALALAIDLGVQAAARLILAAEAGLSEVGAYAAAFGLARPLDLVFTASAAVFSPLLLNAYERSGAAGVRAKAREGFTLMLALAAPAAVGLALVAAPLSEMILGSALSADAARVLPWLAAVGVLSGVNLYYLSEAFQLTQRTGLRALVMIAPAAVQISLTMALAGPFGAAGAAMAAVAGGGLGFVLLFTVGRGLVALPLPLGSLVRMGASTAIMALVVIFTAPAGLGPQVAAGIAVYALAALVLDVAGVRAKASARFARLRASLPQRTEITHAS